jgi:quercetin dioxygenase-like cupin family protein
MFRSILKKMTLVHTGALVVLAAISVGGATLYLTPGSGVISAPVVARASFADPTEVRFRVKNQNRSVITAPNAGETVMQQIVIGPNGHTGWHSHPGPVVVLIKEGEMSFYDADDPTCSVRTYTAGQAFVDSGQGHVHIARNESTTTNLELWATYFDVPAGGGFRIDAPDPGTCSF